MIPSTGSVSYDTEIMNNNTVEWCEGNSSSSEPGRSMLHGKIIQGQSREIVANVLAFMKREAEFGQQIPLRCVTKRVIAATGVSERSIRRIQREAELVFAGGAASFSSPRPKKRRKRALKATTKTVNSVDCGGTSLTSVATQLEKEDLKSDISESDTKTSKMLYPSLEDMKVDQLARAQQPYNATSSFTEQHRSAGISSSPSVHPQACTSSISLYPSMAQSALAPPPYSLTPSAPAHVSSHHDSITRQYHSPVYPTLNDYMGLDLSPETIALNMPEYGPPAVLTAMQLQPVSNTVAPSVGGMVAPLSGQSLGLQRAQVTHGIRELTVCKDAHGKVGLRVQTVNSGVFVCVVVKGSPAALAGLRFGDQILQVNGVIVAGYTMDQVHKLFKDGPINGISVIVRDRPFERTVTLHKNSTGHVGFHFKDGKIVGLVQDSSAARNGLLTDHHVLEVNGQNVVGVPDKDITAVINEGGPAITVTIIPSFVFDHMVKKMSSNLLKTAMDHSIPNV